MPDDTLDQAVLAELLESVGGDREFLVELIDTYLADSPSLVAGMRSGVAAGDATELRRSAHTLKSTSANFGVTRLVAVSREIETAAAAGDLSGLAARVEDAAAEYEAAVAALQAAAVEQGPGGAP
jgi:HPt (histidine-containing phosphotransfer) domain-containing protein